MSRVIVMPILITICSLLKIYFLNINCLFDINTGFKKIYITILTYIYIIYNIPSVSKLFMIYFTFYTVSKKHRLT